MVWVWVWVWVWVYACVPATQQMNEHRSSPLLPRSQFISCTVCSPPCSFLRQTQALTRTSSFVTPSLQRYVASTELPFCGAQARVGTQRQTERSTRVARGRGGRGGRDMGQVRGHTHTQMNHECTPAWPALPLSSATALFPLPSSFVTTHVTAARERSDGCGRADIKEIKRNISLQRWLWWWWW